MFRVMIASAGLLLASSWAHADVHTPHEGNRRGMPNFIHYSSFHVGIGHHKGPGDGQGGGGHPGGRQDEDGPGGGYHQEPEGPEFLYQPKGPGSVYEQGDCIIEHEEERPPQQGGPEDCPQDGGGNQGTLIPSPGAATLGLIGLAGLIRKRRHAGGKA